MEDILPLPLFALAICAFAIGCTEFVVIGILPILAPNLHISIAEAGHLVTWSAGAVIVGAPLLPAISAELPRKTLLILLMAIFTAGNFIAAISSSYEQLILGRILTGLCHGAFFAVSTNVAIAVSPKEKRGSAIAIMFSGLTVALVIGIPLGTFLATASSWAVTFFVVTAFGLLGFLSVLFLVPHHIHYDRPKHMWQQFSILLHIKMLAAYGMTVLSFGGPFIAYTFIAAILRQLTGFNEYWIGALLIVYGVAVAVGNIWGGKLADRIGAVTTIRNFVLTMIAVLIAFYFGQSHKIIAVFLLIGWGIAAFAIVPALQFFVMKLVNDLKLEAADVASGLNIAAYNVGIAGGSYFGSIVVADWGLQFTSLVAAFAVSISLLLIWSGKRIWCKNIR